MKSTLTSTIFFQLLGLYSTKVHAWVDHYDEGEDDAKVVKIFLPLIACAILTCIAGCYFKKHCEGESSSDTEGGDPDITQDYKSHPDTKSVKSVKAIPIDPTLSEFDRKMMMRRQSRMSKGRSIEDHPNFDNSSIKDPHTGHIVATNQTWHASSGKGDHRRGSKDSVGSIQNKTFGFHPHSPSHRHQQPGIPPHSPINPQKKTTSRNTEITGFDSSDTSFPSANLMSMDNSELPPQARPRQHKSLRGQMSNLSNLSNISRSQSDHPSRRGSRHPSGHNKEHIEITGGLIPEFSQWSYLLEKDPCDMTEEELIKWQQMNRARASLPNRPGNFREEEHHFS